MVRGIVRAAVRAGDTLGDATGRVNRSFPRIRDATIRRLWEEETTRQAAVDVVANRDKRRNVDIASLAVCPPGTDQVRIGVTLIFPDPVSGGSRRWGDSHVVAAQGRLADILNDVLGRSIDAARGQGYEVPEIRSAMTTGRTKYRIDYIECA